MITRQICHLVFKFCRDRLIKLYTSCIELRNWNFLAGWFNGPLFLCLPCGWWLRKHQFICIRIHFEVFCMIEEKFWISSSYIVPFDFITNKSFLNLLVVEAKHHHVKQHIEAQIVYSANEWDGKFNLSPWYRNMCI